MINRYEDRFDLLYLILDRVDEDADRRLAKHLVTLYMEDNPFTAGVDIVVRMTLKKKKALFTRIVLLGH